MKEWPLMSKVKVKLKLSLLSLCCNQCYKSSAPLEVEMEHKSMEQDIRPNRTMEKKFVILAEVPWYGYRNHFLPDLKPIRHHCEVWKMTAYLQPTFTQLHLRWSARRINNYPQIQMCKACRASLRLCSTQYTVTHIPDLPPTYCTTKLKQLIHFKCPLIKWQTVHDNCFRLSSLTVHNSFNHK